MITLNMAVIRFLVTLESSQGGDIQDERDVKAVQDLEDAGLCSICKPKAGGIIGVVSTKKGREIVQALREYVESELSKENQRCAEMGKVN